MAARHRQKVQQSNAIAEYLPTSIPIEEFRSKLTSVDVSWLKIRRVTIAGSVRRKAVEVRKLEAQYARGAERETGSALYEARASLALTKKYRNALDREISSRSNPQTDPRRFGADPSGAARVHTLGSTETKQQPRTERPDRG